MTLNIENKNNQRVANIIFVFLTEKIFKININIIPNIIFV